MNESMSTLVKTNEREKTSKSNNITDRVRVCVCVSKNSELSDFFMCMCDVCQILTRLTCKCCLCTKKMIFRQNDGSLSKKTKQKKNGDGDDDDEKHLLQKSWQRSEWKRTKNISAIEDMCGYYDAIIQNEMIDIFRAMLPLRWNSLLFLIFHLSHSDFSLYFISCVEDVVLLSLWIFMLKKMKYVSTQCLDGIFISLRQFISSDAQSTVHLTERYDTQLNSSKWKAPCTIFRLTATNFRYA